MFRRQSMIYIFLFFTLIFTLSGCILQAPQKPVYVSPPNEQTNMPTNLILRWKSSGSNVTYDVYFGTSSNPTLFKSGLKQTNCTLQNLHYSTTYYWKIVAKNSFGSTSGPVWSFTTKPIPTPNVPTNPVPFNGQTDVSTRITLKWQDNDPNGLKLTYDVYFGTSENPPLKKSGLTSASYTLEGLSYFTKYYWKVVAKNDIGGTKSSNVWSFTTMHRPTYTVSGYVRDTSNKPVNDVTISFSGGYSSVTTNSNGYWSKDGLSGSVVVTPSKSGWTFTPASTTVTGAKNGVNFIGTPPVPITYSVSGYVRDTSENPVNGVTISFSGGYSSVITNSNGYWSKDGLSGSVVVTPSKSGWTFTPASTTVAGAKNDVNFIGTPPVPITYSVSGYVRNNSGNGLSGVTISFTNGYTSVTTNSNGYWSKDGLSGSVTVTPYLSGYTFVPSSRNVSGPTNDVNFTGTENVSGSMSIENAWILTTNGTPTSGQVYSSPAISPNGVVFIGSQQGLFFKFSSNSYNYFKSHSPVWSAPVIDQENNAVFVGNNGGQLIYSYSPFDNAYTVNVSTYAIISAPLVYGENIYIVDHLGNVYKMTESSMSPQKIGRVGGYSGYMWSSPVTNGIDLFIGSDNGTFYAVNLENGDVDWSHLLGGPIYGSAALDSNGNVYVCGTKLWSFTPNGNLRWQPVTFDGSRGTKIYANPVISPNGIVYVGTSDGIFYAIDSKTGKILWSEDLSTPMGGISSSAVIGDNGVIYVASGNILYALAPGDGKILSYIKLGYNVESNPVLYDGYIYVGCDDGKLYKIKALSSTTASEEWPMFMSDRYHNGSAR